MLPGREPHGPIFNLGESGKNAAEGQQQRLASSIQR